MVYFVFLISIYLLSTYYVPGPTMLSAGEIQSDIAPSPQVFWPHGEWRGPGLAVCLKPRGNGTSFFPRGVGKVSWRREDRWTDTIYPGRMGSP